ncbi:hypothetical protein EDC94DRAFT_428731 [Helicostylum pulchrum]|uniref:SET domain-containing protein n=1 Tax=Helicostylum pulchrum TaxID=562976 RepID=A0ABP9XTL2_9FUNG|nr:hypothetical protein EDC94DRAFT_428731 [Helicostylum pulchrum]
MNISNFINWSKENGIKSTASVDQTPYAGYGLFASKDTPESTVVVSIPQNLLLTSRKALQQFPQFSKPIFSYLSRKYNTAKDIQSIAESIDNERLVLCLFLIYCKFFDTTTYWTPYIDILPTVSFFQENHVLFKPECVADTSLENSVRSKINSLQREFESITSLQEDWICDMQFEMYLWADCIFWSRVVGIGGDEQEKEVSDKALIPFVDFANHSSESPNIRWQLNNGGIDLITYPNVTVNANDELLLSYGSKPNQELLFLHGFCIENNTEPSLFMLPLLPFFSPMEQGYNLPKVQWLKQLSVKPNLTLVPHPLNKKEDPLAQCGWTDESIRVMYLVSLEEDIEFIIEDDDSITFQLLGKNIPSLIELEAAVKEMDIFPVIQLRVTMLLLDALEYHLHLNTTLVQENIETGLWKQANIYRLEERVTLETTVQSLSTLRDKLMQHPVVLSYLENA